jgi:hypothetical protein
MAGMPVAAIALSQAPCTRSLMLLQMAGRGVEDEEQFGSGLACASSAAPLFPDVGTDVDAAAHTSSASRRRASVPCRRNSASRRKLRSWAGESCDKVAMLPAIFNDRGGVVAARLRCSSGWPTTRAMPSTRLARSSSALMAGPVEIRAQQQVFRRIAAQRQFRRQQDLRATRFWPAAAHSRMRSTLPVRSPTVALNWATASTQHLTP